MKMDKVAGSGNDEFYTPRYAIRPILEHVRPNSTIWCPFDTDKSLFKEVFEDAGHNVICSHIDEGDDFFEISARFIECDYIISNPPYSLKKQVFEKLFTLNIPFAMLVGVAGLFESQARFEMFRDNMFEIMYMNRRVSYFKDYLDEKPALNPPFSSVYLCHGMLPKQICFAEIDKKDL